MEKENRYKKQTGPSIASGMDDSEELERDASEEEVRRGESTSVTTLSYDEVDKS